MVAFTHFKKLAFPSSMPDVKNEGKNIDSRGGSVMENHESASQYKTINSNNKGGESEDEKKQGLNGRKSEEPPDRISYKANRIESGKREDNSSPDFTTKNVKIIPKNKISLQPQKTEKPVQIIMKVGNLFLSNVNTGPNSNLEIEGGDPNLAKDSNIEAEDYSKTAPKLKLDSARLSPPSDLSRHISVKKPKTNLKKEKGNFIDKVNKRSKGASKFSSTLTSKLGGSSSRRANITPRDSKRVTVSNSPINKFGKRPDSKQTQGRKFG